MSHPYIGKICPHCGKPLLEQDTIAVCDTCGVPQHLACWQQQMSCSIPNCPGKIREVISPDQPAPAAPEAPPAAPAEMPPLYSSAAPGPDAPAYNPPAGPGAPAYNPPPAGPAYNAPPGPGYQPPVYAAPPVKNKKAGKKQKPPRAPKPNGKKKHTGLIITLCIAGALVIAAAVLSAIFYFIPLYHYNEADKALKHRDYDEAYEGFAALEDFKDSEEMADKALYKKACALLDDEEYDAAEEQFRELGKYRDSDEMVLECRYQQACALLEDGDYDQAELMFSDLIEYEDSRTMIQECQYRRIKDLLDAGSWKEAVSLLQKMDYKDSQQLCQAAKYNYIQEHLSNQDTTTYEYLTDLCEIYYMDSNEIYYELYSWRVEGGFHLTKDADSPRISDVSAYTPQLYAIFELTGGLPGETINLTKVIRYPNGETSQEDYKWIHATSGTYIISWNNGLYDRPTWDDLGYLTVELYNADTGDLLCSESVYVEE